jgi:diacylglycerol kinase family enzyme
MGGFLIVNPRSGDGRTGTDELLDEARRRGIRTHVLEESDDPAEVARSADADALGIAGGDGSLAAVAGAALDAFGGTERRIDVGRTGERLFLNNVSLGLYAQLVHRREHHRRRRKALARARSWLILLTHREPLGIAIDGRPEDTRLVLVANNCYELDLPTLGARNRLDEGLLYLYVLGGPTSGKSARRFEIDAAAGRLEAAIDGEPELLETPIEFRIEQKALRVLVPPPRG